jgi:hypothetical protein
MVRSMFATNTPVIATQSESIPVTTLALIGIPLEDLLAKRR